MISRRRFLQMAGAGAAGLVSGGLGALLDSQPADAQTKSLKTATRNPCYIFYSKSPTSLQGKTSQPSTCEANTT